MLKAVFFDLYETLITEWDGDKKKATVPVEQLLGIEPDLYKKEWQQRFHNRMTGIYPDFPSVIYDIYHSLGLSPDEEVIHRVSEERHAAKAIAFEEIEDQVIDLLKEIKSRNLKIGLISNCAIEEVVEWKNSKLAPFFDDFILSYEVGLAKPDPRIYHLACDRLSVTPNKSIFIGDGGSNEWEGAINAGLIPFHAAWFQPEGLQLQKSQPGVQKLQKPEDLIPVIDGLMHVSRH